MVREFEGRSEREAVENAVEALGITRDQFDVEVINTEKGGFFGTRRKVTIRVHLPDSSGGGSNLSRGAAAETASRKGAVEATGGGGAEEADAAASPEQKRRRRGGRGRRSGSGRSGSGQQRSRTGQHQTAEEGRTGRSVPVPNGGGERESKEPQKEPEQHAATTVDSEPEDDFEHAIVEFVEELTERMGLPCSARIMYREEDKLGIRLEGEHSGVIIGRKGRNLDALQLLTNVVATRLVDDGAMKVILDAEGYRSRREESLIRLAHKVGDEVKRTRKSRLLEPMNPFERRLVHTALNDVSEIGTHSEGEGLYKQVRIYHISNSE